MIGRILRGRGHELGAFRLLVLHWGIGLPGGASRKGLSIVLWDFKRTDGFP